MCKNNERQKEDQDLVFAASNQSYKQQGCTAKGDKHGRAEAGNCSLLHKIVLQDVKALQHSIMHIRRDLELAIELAEVGILGAQLLELADGLRNDEWFFGGLSDAAGS